ncbi:copper resistance protein CopC [Streptomyces sp. ODS28]|uniref:copper resistance protein CopC n=1 Tax=Streptomyces sp. ODS28 TaxID=3136688 RepID=UPI0031EA24F5
MGSPRAGRSGPARLLASALATALGGLLCVLGGAAPASAHAALTGSDPAKGAVVDSAPREVTLRFSEGIAMSEGSVRVLGPRGERADHGPVREKGETARSVALKPGLGKGTYTVAWQGVSADSHPVSGAFTFSIGAPSKTTAQVPQQDENAGGGVVGALYGIGRYAAYAGFVLLVGGAAFVLACWPGGARQRSVQRLVAAGWLTLTVSTLAMLLLRGPYTGSGQLADVFDLSALKAAVGTKPGTALVSRLLLLGAAALFVSVLFGTYAKVAGEREGGGERERDGARERGGGQQGSEDGESAPEREDGGGAGDPTRRRDLLYGLSLGGGVVAAGLAATWAMAEHASTGIQTALAMPVDVLHLLAVAGWLGGLAALLTSLYKGPEGGVPRSAVRRFSRMAFGSVLVLAGTGIYQSWRQVGSWGALADTAYGQLLIVKVALVALLVGVAWISRRWTSRLAEPERGAASGTSAEAAEPAPRTEREPAIAVAGAASYEGSGAGEDPERAAQLARQRAAVETARRKRDRDADPERSGLRRSVLAEAGIAVVLLAVTTVLTGTEPARTEAATRAGGGSEAPAQSGPVQLKIPFDTGGSGGKGTAKLRLSPGRSGSDNTLRVTATDPSGKPVDAPEVKVAFTLPAQKIGPLNVSPKPVKPGKGEDASGKDGKGSEGKSASPGGRWEANGVQLPMPGTWRVAFTIRTSDIDQVTVNKTVRLP